jgi:transposase
MPRNILNLPSYAISSIEEEDHDYHIWAEATRHPSTCQHCGYHEIVGFGRREQLIRDLPMHGKRVGIYVDTRRYRCRQCGKTFYERLPDVDEKRLMTARLVDWVGKQAVKRPFAHLADEVGLAENTVKNVFRDYINDLERTVRFEVPRWMGIDEIHIIKKPRCIISNIEHNTAVEVLRDRTKKTVMGHFQTMQGREKVQYVAMDMWNPYREAVEALMPQATILIDKFHVVRMANEALETIRKAQRAQLTTKERRGLMRDRFVLLKRRHDLTDKEYLKLSGWTANYPMLGAAYDAKEAFYGIWDMDARAEAERAYAIWRDNLTPEVREAFHPLVRAMENWHPYIFAYFDHAITNAYTESLNNLIRVMNRLGRGYSFEALRAKILFSEGIHKVKRPNFKRKRQPPPDTGFGEVMMRKSISFMRPEPEEKEINYGADLSTLVKLIENGGI